MACPEGRDDRLTAALAPPIDGPPVAPAKDEGVVVRGFELARAVLRASGTRQAGFKAELMDRKPGDGRAPILFLEGKEHHEQRRRTAPFFTPKAVREKHRALMEAEADRLVARVAKKGGGDLSEFGMEMATAVTAQIVGLTEKPNRDMARRINAFFKDPFDGEEGRLRKIWNALKAQFRLLRFYRADVKPAIAARRAEAEAGNPRDDVISHLLQQGYSNVEILTECVTYAAAGIVTTREFLSIAIWHLLRDKDLQATYLAAEEKARLALLEEILRLEPVVGTIYRRTTEPLALPTGDTLPAGTKVAIDVRAANGDATIAGECPFQAVPGREPAGRAGSPMLSFGDGHHRCPGAPLAILESDVLLTRLLALPGLALERDPKLGWNALVTGYELRDVRLTCTPA